MGAMKDIVTAVQLGEMTPEEAEALTGQPFPADLLPEMSAMILTGGGWVEDTRETFEYSCAGRHDGDSAASERHILGMDRAIALCDSHVTPS